MHALPTLRPLGAACRLAALLGAAALLVACASGPRVLDAQVSTDAAVAPGAGLLDKARYRFMPPASESASPEVQQLQVLAAQALERVGAIQDEPAARVGVEVTGGSHAYWLRDSDLGLSNPRIALGIGTGWHGASLGFGWPLMDPDIPRYSSEVSLVMRDLQSGQIIYRTSARHDGASHNTREVLAALFVAALQGYPAPGQRVRHVRVPLLPASGQDRVGDTGILSPDPASSAGAATGTQTPR